MNKRYWYVILTYIIMQVSGAIFIPLLTKNLQIDVFQAFIYWSLFSFSAGLFVILILMIPDMKKPTSPDAANIGGVILWSISGIFIAYVAQIIAALIEMNVFGIQPGSENTASIMNVARAAPIFIIIPTIIAPILEEILFRKIIFGALYSRSNFFIAAVISAVIFGLIHGEPVHMLVYTTMGLVFAALYVKTKRIIVPIIAHMGMNSIAVIAQYSIDPEELERMLKELEQLQMIFLGG